ncbi:uncharacterized protein LOC108622728 [Ceratina calcarata]|uniref:Uncharacterized protein LOC108622728 n=1 Tax=Ceratina calcarata TaxID=156304 RepID=A0AAJ7N3S9_9HYME|nr:uncharacterized protein LOC108622728 [Ceratina calcarata]
MIQEPWTPKKDRIGALNAIGEVLSKQQEGIETRACMAVSKRLKLVLLPQFSNRDMTTAMLEQVSPSGRINKLVIASWYLPHHRQSPIDGVMENTINWCNQQGLEYIAGTDANACNTAWGSTKTNKRGETLLEFLESNELTWANEGHKPTFTTCIREEVLDITIVSVDKLIDISKWRVDKRKVDWKKFREELAKNKGNIPKDYGTSDQLDLAADSLNELIGNAAMTASKVIKGVEKIKVPWWNSDLTRLRDNCRKLKSRARRTTKNCDKIRAQRAERQLKDKIKRNKKESWRKFCGSLKTTKNIAKLTKIMERTDSSNLGLLKKNDDTFTKSTKETLELLLRTHGSYKKKEEAKHSGSKTERHPTNFKEGGMIPGDHFHTRPLLEESCRQSNQKGEEQPCTA